MTALAPYDLWLDNTQQNSPAANNNTLRNEVLLLPVTSTLNAPAGSEPENTLVIVGSAPTGLFAGWANQLAIKKSGVWLNYTGITGLVKWHIALATNLRWTGAAWVDEAQVFGGLGTALASASTVTIANLIGDYGHITGTTTITSFGTATKPGLMRQLVFDGILTLTNGANLILPTGANIVTAAGDMLIARAETTSIWRVIAYHRADGTALVTNPSAMEYKGAWNASTNSPTLANGVGNSGDTYRVSVAGTRNLGAGSVDYAVGDSVVYNSGTAQWDHFDNSQAPVTLGEMETAAGFKLGAHYGQYLNMGSQSGAVNIDLSYRHIYMQLTGNVTLTFTNLPPAGRIAECTVEFQQDGTGGRTVTHPGGTAKWPSGIAHVMRVGASEQDDVLYRVRSTGAYSGYPVEDMSV